jgi:UPF0148 protein
LSRRADEGQAVKRMADLLRQGATLTDMACPECASPLFRLKDGSLWCARDEKKVIIVREGEDEARVTSGIAFDNLENTLLKKIQDMQEKMQHTEDVNELQKIGVTLTGLLENLEKLRRMKKTR